MLVVDCANAESVIALSKADHRALLKSLEKEDTAAEAKEHLYSMAETYKT